MKIDIITSYDEEQRILRVKNEHDVEWQCETGVPEVYLASIIGSSFAISVKSDLDFTAEKIHKYRLTIEKI